MLHVREVLCSNLDPHIGSTDWGFSGISLSPSKHMSVSWYSYWLRAGRLRDRSSSAGRLNNFIFSKSSRPTLGSTQPPIQWVPGGSFPGGKAAGAWSWPLTSSYCRGQENVDLYVHSPIRLHGVVFNSLSTGTTLPCRQRLFPIYLTIIRCHVIWRKKDKVPVLN
jgi:hypothetical protein